MALLSESIVAGAGGHLNHTAQVHKKLNRLIDVRADFGAVGDGSTDDTAAIQAAIDAVGTRSDFSHTLGLHRVVLPYGASGTYKITSPLTVTEDFVLLEGATPGIRILNTTTGNDVVRLNHGNTAGTLIGVGLKNLTLEGTGTGSKAIYANLIEHLIIENVNCIDHPGPALYMESGNAAILSGCAFAQIRQLLCQPSGAVTSISDLGGINNVYDSCRTREAEIGYYFENASGCVLRAPYIESNTRGTAKTGVKCRVTDTAKRRRTLRIEDAYFENNTTYAVDADDSYFVEIQGGQSSGGTDESTKANVSEFRLDGGGIVTGLRANSTKFSSSNGRVEFRETWGITAALSRSIFHGVMPPLIAGRSVINAATVSWFDTDPTWSATGTSAPTLSHDTSNAFLGLGSKKAIFATGGSGAAFARARMDNATQTLSSGDPWYGIVAFKSDVSGECIRFRQTGASDEQTHECLTGTDWQIAMFEFAPVSTAGAHYISLELGAAVAGSTSIWVGAVAVSTSSSAALINTDGPAIVDGEILGRKLNLGRRQTYSVSNLSTDRTYDANSTTTDELADVLGTLIADLRAAGVVA